MQHEIEADNVAHFYLSLHYEGEKEYVLKVGIVVALCSILLSKSNFGCGSSYPDHDDRLINILHKMEIEDDNPVWGIAVTGLKLWSLYYDNPIIHLDNYVTYKDYFFQIVEDLKKEK